MGRNMTNEELVTKIQAGENVSENMLRLWQQNQGIIHRVANRYQQEDEEDILQQSYLGLHQAVVNYKNQNDFSFAGYLTFTLRWHLNKYCRDCVLVRLPVNRLNTVFRYLKLQQDFLVSFGREPTDSEIADVLGVSGAAIQRLKQDAANRQATSLDTPIAGCESEEISLIDVTPDKTVDVEGAVVKSIAHNQLCSALEMALGELPEQQAFVIRKRFLDGETLETIGKRLNSTREQAKAIQESGLRKLRKNKALKGFTDDEIYRRGTRGCGVECFKHTWTSSTEKTALMLCGKGE